ncbi:MAG: hydrogenase small subunit [Spirochaetales bacterium]|nr:hydrogenase small subunit [Spirochaetales bacterium]
MKSFIMSRRDFFKFCLGGVTVFGLSTLAKAETPPEAFTLPELKAESLPELKPGVVWLEAQDCAGCTESVLSCLTPDLKDFVLDDVAIRYHETIMAGTGEKAEEALEAAIEQGGYVLVLEGSIPEVDSRYLRVAGKSVEETFVRAASAAALVITAGACAAYGGIPKAGTTGAEGARYFLEKHCISTPLINLPGCPVHPQWFFTTVYEYLNTGSVALDEYNRPLSHFACTIHDNCPRRQHYDAERYLRDWNNPAQKQFCLLLKGCRGTKTHADCPVIEWNERANWCIGNNAPCAGCTEPSFYQDSSGLYTPQQKCK